MICIGDSLEESKKGAQLTEKYDGIFCTVGVHPHHAKHWQSKDVHTLISMLEMYPKICGIGEIGLDYHYDFSPRGVQQGVFEEQLTLANMKELPSVIHCREAIEDVWAIVRRVGNGNFVLHCCTEKWGDVKKFVNLGCMLSFTGIATYPKSEEIRNTIKHCPLDQLMIETDAPFLAPVPHRGKRNEPAFIVEVAKCVAEIKGISLKEVDEATTENAVEFFGL